MSTKGGGSPLAHRSSDGHVFASFGEVVPLLREYSAAGALLNQFVLATTAETMALDPASGRIYYSPNGSAVRRFDPAGPSDVLVANVSGTVNGGRFFDPASGRLFAGTANGANPGQIEIIDPATGESELFATGFDPENEPGGALGILRHSTTGDLYVVQSDALWRLDSSWIFPPAGVPTLSLPGAVAAAGLLLAAGAFGPRCARTGTRTAPESAAPIA